MHVFIARSTTTTRTEEGLVEDAVGGRRLPLNSAVRDGVNYLRKRRVRAAHPGHVVQPGVKLVTLLLKRVQTPAGPVVLQASNARRTVKGGGLTSRVRA